MFILNFIRDILVTAGKFVVALLVLLLLALVTILALVFNLILNAPM